MLQGTLFPPEAPWRPPDLADLPQDWSAFPRISIDTETCDPKLRKLGPGVRRGAYIAGVSFAVDKQRGFYLPVRHQGGDNMEDPGQALAYVRDQASRYRGEVVGAKLGYDLDFLSEASIDFHPDATFKDVQVADPLLDELQLSYSLDSILARHGMPLKDEHVLREAAAAFRLDPKADLHKLPARYVGAYAEADALRPMALLEVLEAEIERRNLGRVWALECEVLPVLVRMRRRGVRIDFDQLDRVERFSRAGEATAWAELYKVTGVSVAVGDAMKPEPLARALEAVGVAVPKTATTRKPSITKGFLAMINHPAAAAIRRGRQMSQLRTTFVASMREHEVRGRIHTTFNQTVVQKDEDNESEGTEGARPGRLSSVDPNLQQQPARDPEFGPMWRKVFLPDEGGEWATLDYSQQEPRGAVHFAVATGAERMGRALGSMERGRVAFASALEAQRRYVEDPKTDAHTMFTAMVYGDHVYSLSKPELKLLRDPMKNVFLGICYGEGGPKLCRELGYPTRVIVNERTGRRYEVAGEEGQALLNLVDRRVPYIRATARAVEAVAKERGYIITAGGRHCHFPTDEHGNFDFTHKGFNRAIQGTAADQAKRSLVVLDRAGMFLQLQVHDENDGTMSSRAEGERYARMQEECFPLNVPSKVDLEMGPSWGEAA